MEKESKSHVGFWDIWVVVLRILLAKLEIWFEKYGKNIANNPWKVICVSLVFVGVCCSGFINLQNESRVDRLFVPENSPSENALKAASPFFSTIFNTREAEVILVPKNGTNIITQKCMQEVVDVTKRVLNSPDYAQVCLPKPMFLNKVKQFNRTLKCSILSPAEIFNKKISSNTYLLRKIVQANRDVTKLMSNGRAPVFNLQMIFSHLQHKTSKLIRGLPTLTAKGVRLIFYLKQSEEKYTQNKILQWEKNFLKDMENYATTLECSNLFYASARSLDDAVIESSSSDIVLITVTFIIMIAFSCSVMSRCTNTVRGHSLLSVAGVFSTGMGIAAGLGLMSAFGIPFISLVGVMPFLILSIGIDDTFILVDSFDRTSTNQSPRTRVANSLSSVGATITMTTITDIVAFIVSIQTSFPAIRYFCFYAASCITIEFVLQMSFFVAVLSFDARRINSMRMDCIPCFRTEDKNKCRIPNNWSFSEKIMGFYTEKVLSKSGKCVVLSLAFILLAGGIYGSINVSSEFDRKALAKKDSYYYKYLDVFEKMFPQTIPVNLQITEKVDYSDPNVQRQLLESPKLAYDTGFYLPLNFSWIHFYKDWANLSNLKTTGASFNRSIQAFLDNPLFIQHNVDVIRDKYGKISASRILVFMKNKKNSNFQRDAMLSLRKHLEERLSIPLESVANPFIFFEQYASVVQEVSKNLFSAALVIMFLVTPFCVHPLLIVMVVMQFVLLIVNIFGLMYFWNVALDVTSMINLVMAIGFSVDYSAHVAHAFITSTKKDTDAKIREALVQVGVSVLMGGLSTFLGMLSTAFASSQIFITFFKMFFGIVLFGLFNGVCLLPVLLSIFGHWIETTVNASTSSVVSAVRSLWNRLQNFSFRRKNNSLAKSYNLLNKNSTKQVSVVGISAKFPTAESKNEFWDLLVDGKDTITEYPKDREARFRYFEDNFNPTRPVPGRLYVSRGSYMEDIEQFDYKFFGISATEAKSMDPQQRLMLQGTFEAIEDAGLKLEDLQRCSTGVYVGIMNLDYSSVVLRDDVMLTIDQFASTGTAFSIAANRISFALNLTGPSIAIDTACSSSLTALSVACDNLRDGKCDIAVVCAANLILCPKKQVTICRANMLSPDGKCKVFADEADGYGRGEGCLAVILKRKDHALCSDDEIYADILGWGVNNDGQTAAPMTAPSEEGQKLLLVDTLNKAGVSPQDIQYVEMHGTGTIIGDLVETKSVGEVYGKIRPQNQPLRVGSVKSNVNHTESAAGLAGLAKVCLMFEKKKYIATVNVKNQNPRLILSEKNILVQDCFEYWPENLKGLPRLASINSFGYGGSNAHFVLKEATSKEKSPSKCETMSDKKRVFILSARCLVALLKTAKRFSDWISSFDDNNENITNILYSISQRRTEHNHRVAIEFDNLQTAAQRLSNLNKEIENVGKKVCYGQTITSSGRIGFLFGGQGSQWRGMGSDLMNDPFIKKVVYKVHYLAQQNGHTESVIDYLTTHNDSNSSENMITTQLSIFAIEYAVAELLMKKAGIDPFAVGGHSLGDITASCVSGHVNIREAVIIIMARAGLQETCPKNGSMAAAGLSVKEANDLLSELKLVDHVEIAAENDQQNITFSGDEEAIDQLDTHFKNNNPGVFWRKLKVDKAFHSRHMENIKKKFFKLLEKADIRIKPGKIKMFSSVDGKEIVHTDLDNDYWWRNVRNAVLFNQCTQGILKEGCTLLLEISPRPVLSHYITNIIKQAGYDNKEEEYLVLQALPRIKEEERYSYLLINCIGKMYTLGYSIDWKTLMDLQNGEFVRYPNYAWNTSPLWSFDPYATYETTMSLLGKPVRILNQEKCWQNEIDTHNFEYLDDHNMKAAGCILPGAAYLEMAFEAALEKSAIDPVIVQDLNFYNILPLPKQVVRIVRTRTKRKAGDAFVSVEISNLTETSEVSLASAFVKAVPDTSKEKTLSLHEAMNLGRRSPPGSASPDMSLRGSGEYSTDSEIKTEKRLSAEGPGARRSSCSNKSSGISSITDATDNCELLQEESGIAEQAANLDENLMELKQGYEDVMTAEEFNDLASQTGFNFGESFKLIERVWCNDNSALVKLRLAPNVTKTLSHYVIHPSIIDATLQTCIAIKSTDRSRPVIPIGIERVRLCTPKGPIESLYAYAEVNRSVPDSCDLKLLDNNGNILLYIYAFKVKDLRRASRYPNYEDSIYKIDWVPYLMDTSKMYDAKWKWLLIGVLKSAQVKAFMKALSEVNVDENSVKICDIKGKEGVENFDQVIQDQLQQFEKSDEVVAVNLLPCLAQTVECSVQQAMSAQWLVFESTLQLLKSLVKNDNKYRLLVITSGSQAYEVTEKNVDVRVPWSSTAWGLQRVSNHEQGKVPTVCADISIDATSEDFKKVIKVFCSPDAYEGFAVHQNITYVPQFKRHLTLEYPEKMPQKKAENNDIYMTWSHEQQSFALKEWVRLSDLKVDEVEINISYLSSNVGEVKSLLENVKNTSSYDIPYCFVGHVTKIGMNVTNFSIGECVLGIHNSRWIQTIIHTKPDNLMLCDATFPQEQLAVLAFCFAHAYEILAKIKLSIPEGGKILLIAMPKYWGFYYAIALIATSHGYKVTIDSMLSGAFSQNIKCEELEIQQIYQESLKVGSSLQHHFDCVFYPAETNVIDTEAYINILNQDGSLVALHTKGDSGSKVLRLENQIMLFNISLDKRDLIDAPKVLSCWRDCLHFLDKSGNKQQLLNAPYCTMTMPYITESSFCAKSIMKSNSFLYSSLSLVDLMEKTVFVIPPSMDTQGLKYNCSYVVVGGAKGLGLDTVRWMLLKGAGTVITVGRSDLSQDVQTEFSEMRQKHGVNVIYVKGDISHPNGICSLEAALDRSPPLAGIVNSAVVLDDKIFMDVDRENYKKVMGPKICGTIALHNMTEKRGDKLDFFVLFSSITSVLGNVGQTTYSASNAFMNSFAEYRQHVLGKPCLSVCWGAMGGTGILERDFKTASMLESRGLHLLHIKEGLQYLERILTTMPSQACVSVCDVEWGRYLKGQSEKRLASPFLQYIQKEFSANDDDSHTILLELLKKAKSIEKRKEILKQFISRWLAAWIGGSEEEIDMNVPLFTYGIDSVGASAIKSEIEKELEISLEVFHFMQAETTGNKLSSDLLRLFHEKIQGKKENKSDEQEEEDEDDDDSDTIKVPKDFIQRVYDPPGASANFFCIHPSHRYTGILLPIAQGFKFQKIFRMFTIGSQNPAYMSEDYGSVHKLAKAYIKLIKKHQNMGPYFIGGYSFGGLLSLEIASILSRKGDRVELVVMLDTVRWIPKGRNNSQMLLEMYQEDSNPETHIKAQLLGFMNKIATLQLGIRVEDFEEMIKIKSFEEMIAILSQTAEEKGIAISDLQGIYESTANDQALASRCHNEWEPSQKLYQGRVLYIHAEDDEFCKAIPGLGSAVQCWKTILEGTVEVVGASGNHYTMLTPGRAADIGSIIATAVLISYRRLYPTNNRLPSNNCQRVAIRRILNGINVAYCDNQGNKSELRFGKLKISKNQKKLKIRSTNTKQLKKEILLIKNICNIVKLSLADLPAPKSSNNSYRYLHQEDLYAGLSIRFKNGFIFNIIGHERQDCEALCGMFKEVFALPLQLSAQ